MCSWVSDVFCFFWTILEFVQCPILEMLPQYNSCPWQSLHTAFYSRVALPVLEVWFYCSWNTSHTSTVFPGTDMILHHFCLLYHKVHIWKIVIFKRKLTFKENLCQVFLLFPHPYRGPKLIHPLVNCRKKKKQKSSAVTDGYFRNNVCCTKKHHIDMLASRDGSWFWNILKLTKIQRGHLIINLSKDIYFPTCFWHRL